MRDEYDLAKAQRGQFFRPGAELQPPVHLEPEVLTFLRARDGARRFVERTGQHAAEEGVDGVVQPPDVIQLVRILRDIDARSAT